MKVYVVWPAGTKIDGEYITPAILDGRKSGHQHHAILTAGGFSWGQWIHIDNILFEDEVEQA